MPWQQNWVVVTETVWRAKLDTFTIWPFIDNVSWRLAWTLSQAGGKRSCSDLFLALTSMLCSSCNEAGTSVLTVVGSNSSSVSSKGWRRRPPFSPLCPRSPQIGRHQGNFLCWLKIISSKAWANHTDEAGSWQRGNSVERPGDYLVHGWWAADPLKCSLHPLPELVETLNLCSNPSPHQYRGWCPGLSSGASRVTQPLNTEEDKCRCPFSLL